MNRPFSLPNAAFQNRAEAALSHGFLPRGWISGLTLSNDSTDATNDIGIAAGVCRTTCAIVDGSPSTLSRHQRDIDIPVSIIKQIDVAWAPDNYDPEGYSGGGRSGGRSSSSLSDTTWHVFAIGSANLPPDVLIHDSVTQSSVLGALPSGYNCYRRIGSIIRSTSIRAFTQIEDSFWYVTPPLDVSGSSNITTTSALYTLTVPAGLRVKARMNVYLLGQAYAYLRHPSDTDSAPSLTAAPLATIFAVAATVNSVQTECFTNTSAQIAGRSNVTTDIKIATLGYEDARGRDL